MGAKDNGMLQLIRRLIVDTLSSDFVSFSLDLAPSTSVCFPRILVAYSYSIYQQLYPRNLHPCTFKDLVTDYGAVVDLLLGQFRRIQRETGIRTSAPSFGKIARVDDHDTLNDLEHKAEMSVRSPVGKV